MGESEREETEKGKEKEETAEKREKRKGQNQVKEAECVLLKGQRKKREDKATGAP